MRSLLGVGIAALLFACGGDAKQDPAGPSEPTPSPTTVSISPTSSILDALGATVQFTAQVRDQNGQTMTGQSVTWSSSNPSVATVNTSGLATAVSVGTVTITASAGSASGTASLTVRQVVSTVIVSPSANTLEPLGETVQLSATAQDANGNEITNKAFTWTSSDENIATVNSSGLVTGIAEGMVTITATCEGITGAATVTVNDPVTSVEVYPANATLSVGQTTQLSAIPRGVAGNALEGRTITWASSDESIATVNSSGLVTGIAEGMATITATSDGVSGAATIGVFEPSNYNCSLQSQIPQVECQALVALYDETKGPGWTNSTDWVSTSTPCSWFGVTCEAGSVVNLELFENQLTGSIPAELGNLANLQTLYLSGNQLTGSIPPELGNLANLQSLLLDSNQLTGSIPVELRNLSSLHYLFLHKNQLTGSIPPELGNLANFRMLVLSENQLTGSIPAELGNLSGLQRLWLNNNHLTGSIPPELGTLSSLQYLLLYSNQLTGSIPVELRNLSSLHYLFLYENQLTGSIPPELGSLANLQGLLLKDNQLTGSIPAELGNLANLQTLYLDSNQLTGSIPAELGNLSNLTALDLWGNQLTGSIPAELGNLANLQDLHLQINQLSGLVPLQVAQLGGLIQYNLSVARCAFTPPGNDGLQMPDTQDYRNADLDADGYICGLGFTPVSTPAPAARADGRVGRSYGPSTPTGAPNSPKMVQSQEPSSEGPSS